MNEKLTYLFVGNGRLSKHLQHYFYLLNIPFLLWHRNLKTDFSICAYKADRIIVLIKDDEIEQFISRNKSSAKPSAIWIHCSGSLSTPIAESAHPLMSFADDLYGMDKYKEIYFITEKNRKPFSELFPSLQNNNFQIASEQKALYHAWCVMAGNFSTILWQNFFNALENKFSIPKESSFPYLNAITANLQNMQTPLTGPLVRKDENVISSNILSLEGDPFKNIYQAFVDLYKSGLENEKC